MTNINYSITFYIVEKQYGGIGYTYDSNPIKKNKYKYFKTFKEAKIEAIKIKTNWFLELHEEYLYSLAKRRIFQMFNIIRCSDTELKQSVWFG